MPSSQFQVRKYSKKLMTIFHAANQGKTIDPKDKKESQ